MLVKAKPLRGTKVEFENHPWWSQPRFNPRAGLHELLSRRRWTAGRRNRWKPRQSSGLTSTTSPEGLASGSLASTQRDLSEYRPPGGTIFVRSEPLELHHPTCGSLSRYRREAKTADVSGARSSCFSANAVNRPRAVSASISPRRAA